MREEWLKPYFTSDQVAKNDTLQYKAREAATYRKNNLTANPQPSKIQA